MGNDSTAQPSLRAALVFESKRQGHSSSRDRFLHAGGDWWRRWCAPFFLQATAQTGRQHVHCSNMSVWTKVLQDILCIWVTVHLWTNWIIFCVTNRDKILCTTLSGRKCRLKISWNKPFWISKPGPQTQEIMILLHRPLELTVLWGTAGTSFPSEPWMAVGVPDGEDSGSLWHSELYESEGCQTLQLSVEWPWGFVMTLGLKGRLDRWFST